MLLEAEEAGLGPEEISQIRRLSDATARLVTSHFTEGFKELEQLRGARRKERYSAG